MVKGKTKGNTFENKVYDELRSLNIFARKSKGSGNAEDNKGDIETIHFLIECKHHKKFSEKQLVDFWKKIYIEASNIGKTPILLAKENYKDIRVIVDYDVSDEVFQEIKYSTFLGWIKELDEIK